MNNFKSRHKIVSRRLTNIVTKHQIEDSDVIEKSKQEFIKNYYKLLPKYRSSEVINTDQSGIEKEIYSKRTLTTEGEKKVYGLARSKNATTHSYTIQPIISLDGRIVGPMYLCLQEPNGKMGETVKKNLFKPANVVITCSSSGKLTTSLVSYWRDNCLLPSIGKKCLLLSDSWGGQRDEELYNKKNCGGNDILRLEIPKNTTSDIQPLDSYVNRQIKNFIKKVYNRVALDEIDIEMYQRNNIIKLTSLVHNQLAAPIFQPMIQYSWYASGLMKTNPAPFSNLLDICFPPLKTHEECETDKCDESVFISCAVCSEKLCFKHFFIDFHFHN